MLMEQLNRRAGTRFQPVVYRGTIDALNAAAAGQISLVIADPGPALPAMEAKRLRALAVSSGKRMAQAPEVPTLAEAGLPGLELDNWIGLLAPAGTPEPVLAKLEAAVAEAARAPDVAERLRPLGMAPDGRGQAAFRQVIAADNAVWAQVAKEAGINLSR
jgi:tripartite-type tricarboxylate transporter receptor subunit TctC